MADADELDRAWDALVDTNVERIRQHLSSAEIDAFRFHLENHRQHSVPDCRFCAERDAKKPRPPEQPPQPRASVRDLSDAERASLTLADVADRNSTAADALVAESAPPSPTPETETP